MRGVQKCVSRHDFATGTTFPLRLKSHAREICLCSVFRTPRFHVPCSTPSVFLCSVFRTPPRVPVFRVPLNPRGTHVGGRRCERRRAAVSHRGREGGTR
eukprot:3135892-Prymnesium_polylepis.1